MRIWSAILLAAAGLGRFAVAKLLQHSKEAAH